MQPTPQPQSIADKVCLIIAENLCCDVKHVTPEKDIHLDLDADSLDMVETIMQMETHFKIAIPDEKMESFEKVGDIITYVEERMGAKTYIPILE